MAYNISLTADTLPELLEMAARFGATPVVAASVGVSSAPKTPKTEEKKPEDKKLVDKKADTKKEEPKAEEKKADAPKVLNYQTEVAPLVLKVIDKKGRTFVEQMLERYGVAKASQIKADVLPEFVAELNEIMAS